MTNLLDCLWSIGQDVMNDWKQESSRLSRAGLSTGHQVSIGKQSRNGMFLHRSRFYVAALLDIFLDESVQIRITEALDRLRRVSTTDLDGNVVVLVKVDSTVAGIEEIPFLSITDG